MQPSTRTPNSVTLDKWSEVMTINTALNQLIDVVPHEAEFIRSTMSPVVAGATLASTVHNAYTLLTGDTEQSPGVAIDLTPSQVELARTALAFAAKTSPDALEGDFFAEMAAEIQATAKLSSELNG